MKYFLTAYNHLGQAVKQVVSVKKPTVSQVNRFAEEVSLKLGTYPKIVLARHN